jgi:hypothetical protein
VVFPAGTDVVFAVKTGVLCGWECFSVQKHRENRHFAGQGAPDSRKLREIKHVWDESGSSSRPIRLKIMHQIMHLGFS